MEDMEGGFGGSLGLGKQLRFLSWRNVSAGTVKMSIAAGSLWVAAAGSSEGLWGGSCALQRGLLRRPQHLTAQSEP